FRQRVCWALAFARPNAGSNKLARIAMIAITTRSSMSVNATLRRETFGFIKILAPDSKHGNGVLARVKVETRGLRARLSFLPGAWAASGTGVPSVAPNQKLTGGTPVPLQIGCPSPLRSFSLPADARRRARPLIEKRQKIADFLQTQPIQQTLGHERRGLGSNRANPAPWNAVDLLPVGQSNGVVVLF